MGKSQISDSVIKTSGAIIKNGNGDFLLQLRGFDAPTYPDKWIIFGGHCEGGETPVETVVREIFEELGINFKKERFSYAGDFYFNNESGEKNVTFLFRLSIEPEEKIILGEGVDFGFFKKEEIKNLPVPPWMGEIVEKYF